MSTRETNYDLQARLIEEAMTALGADKPHKGAAIKQWITEHHPEDASRLASSWHSYLTAITQSPYTRIERTPGKYTFFLRTASAQADSAASVADVPPPEEREPPQRRQREQLLYEPLAAWLTARGFPAEVTASKKKGGTWGNPDVAGLKVTETPLAGKHIEVATIEAKLGPGYWRYYFFEAVAHKRFAHRAYFAFVVGTDDPSVVDVVEGDEMREYGEKYGVGVLVIFVPLSEYGNLISGANPTLDADSILVQELWPAVYDPVTPAALNSFLRDVLELHDDRAIYAFGAPEGGA